MFSTLDPKHVRNKLIFFFDGFLVSTVYENEQTEASPVYPDPGGGGTLGTSGWGCAAGTLEPLTYTRASSAEFCYPILE